MTSNPRFSPKAPVCPACGSKVVYHRIKKNDYVCRRCGKVGKKKQFFKPR